MPLALSEQECDKYLNEVVIPAFTPLIEENISCVIYSISGEVLLCSALDAESLGMANWRDLIGLSYAKVCRKSVIDILGIDNEELIQKVLLSCRKIYQLQQIAIKKRRMVSYVNLIPYNKRYNPYLEICLPLFHPCGEVVALQSISSPYKLLNLSDLFSGQTHITKSNPDIPSTINKPDLVLPTRQHEILYLILQGFSQEEVGQLLNITRGTVARIISEQLCPKFGISGSSTRILIEKALESGFQYALPESLWFPNIIVLDQNLAMELDTVMDAL